MATKGENMATKGIEALILALKAEGRDADEQILSDFIKRNYPDVSWHRIQDLVKPSRQREDYPSRAEVLRSRAVSVLADPIGIEQLRKLLDQIPEIREKLGVRVAGNKFRIVTEIETGVDPVGIVCRVEPSDAIAPG